MYTPVCSGLARNIAGLEGMWAGASWPFAACDRAKTGAIRAVARRRDFMSDIRQEAQRKGWWAETRRQPQGGAAALT